MKSLTLHRSKHFLSITLMILIAVAIIGCRADTVEQTPTGDLIEQPTPTNSLPVVKLASPVVGQRVKQGEEVEVRSGSVDEQGIARLVLLVDDQVIDSKEIVPQPNAVFEARQVWVPERPGNYELQVRAYNANNEVGESDRIVVQVEAATAIDRQTATPSPAALAEQPPATPTETPTATPTPAPPTTTSTPEQPYLIVSVNPGLNVRAGPSTRYRRIGQLFPGDQVEIVGQANVGAGRWWQINFPSATSDVAWVSASPDYSAAYHTENIPIVAAPPTPTPPPPTSTPTPVPVAQQTRIDFGVDRAQIRAGECATFFWNVSNVKEVYFNGAGVPGESQARRVCPATTTYYELRVIKRDGQTETRTIKIEVEGASVRGIEMDLGESVDFDRDGRVSHDGDDFIWHEPNGEDKRFEKWDDDDDLELVPVGPVDSLDIIRREDCDWALDNLDDDRYIEPFDGLAACIRTDDGRIGKIRFEDVDDEVDIEWFVWG